MVEPTGEVHPVAALLPMLSDEDLSELAADIAENGLRQPVVLDADGVLLDGRNRLEGCRRAGVAPTYVVYTGDPVAFIRASNLRRNISKGQWAMFLVEQQACSTSEQTTRKIATDHGASIGYVGMAAVVHAEAHPNLCDLVLAGGSLKEAYGHAQRIRQQREAARHAARDAAEQARRAAEQAERQLAALTLALEEIGPAVPVPAPPELAAVPVIQPSSPAPRLANIAAEQAYADQMAAIKQAVTRLAGEPVCITAMPALAVAAARSWATQVVALVYQIVEAHNAALAAEQSIRSVS